MPRKSTKSYVEESVGIRLSSHERLCAERMKTLNETMTELKKEVKSLRADMNKGKGAVNVLIFLAGIIATVIGIFQFK